MAIRVERIRADIDAIAACTQTPGDGATRPTFSAAWADARKYVISQLENIGCQISADAFGNLHARPAALDVNTPALLCGSHIDTVPRGGNFDGVVGIVVALELLRSAHEGDVNSLPLELIIFAEEEGPTFGLGMLGSRAWVGELSAAQLADLKNADGENYLDAGKKYGVDAIRFAAEQFSPQKYLGLIELHIEQGPGMWRRNQSLAIVHAIAGRRQYRVALRGEANHAGATAMSDRRDALCCAAEIITHLESLAPHLSAATVITVGRVNNHPNAVNVIADRVEFTIDFRADDDAILERGDSQIDKSIREISSRRKIDCDFESTESISARKLDSQLCDRLQNAARSLGVTDLPQTVSGALHDSAVLAPHLPTAMLFIPSRGGISHNPAEFSRVEDVALGAAVIERMIRKPTLAQINTMSQQDFVDRFGSAFEHSPWIAEQAWNQRPFNSLADLQYKMIAIVESAALTQQVSLISAHPDLVGKLAREGKLTNDSTAEQSAAGLSKLSADEVAAFETFNAAYRERFDFPFVICAREHRKNAILAAFPVRLKQSRETEIATALSEIYKIARLRIAAAVLEK